MVMYLICLGGIMEVAFCQTYTKNTLSTLLRSRLCLRRLYVPLFQSVLALNVRIVINSVGGCV